MTDDMMLDGLSDQQGGAAGNPIMKVLRTLRGRIWLVIVLAAVLAPIGAVAGYMAMPPVYTSTGRVAVNPANSQAPILFDDTAGGGSFRDTEAIVRSEVITLQSARILELACQDEQLRQRGWPGLPEGRIRLANALDVRVSGRSRDIMVSVTDADARLAKEAVDAVLRAYDAIELDKADANLERRLSELRQLRDRYADDTRRLSQRARERVLSVNEVDLDEAIGREQDRIRQLEQELAGRQAALDALGADASTQQLTASNLAAFDPELATLRDRANGIEFELSRLSATLGPNHRETRQMAAALESTQRRMEQRVQELRSSIDGIQAAMARTRQQVETAVRTRQQLAELRSEVLDIQADVVRQQELYEQARFELEKLEVERRNRSSAEIEIVNFGDVPVSPSRDRRKVLAAMGAAGGSGASLALVVGFGLLRQRVRFVEDIEPAPDGEVSIYGVIPELDRTAEGREMAASSVHFLRNMLELRSGRGTRSPIYTVTSATAGEGKTTTAMALAQSFALSGRKTLLVDADLVGQGLSLDRGLADEPGFGGMVLAGEVDLSVIHQNGPNTPAFLPAGQVMASNPDHFSPKRVRALLDGLRSHYETIVIDTGPILGSLEASAIATGSDAVLLIVSRGKHSRLFKSAVERLQHLQAARIGIVFNRARRHELARSTSAALSGSSVARSQRGDKVRVLSLLSSDSEDKGRQAS